MADYAGVDIWHPLQLVLAGNNRPSAANLAQSGSEPDMDRFLYIKNRGARSVVVSSGQVTVGGGVIAAPVEGQANTWQDFTSANGLVPYVDVGTVAVGDIIEVHFESGFVITGGQDYADVQLVAVQDYGGANTTAAITGAVARIVETADAQLPARVVLGGYVTVSVAGPLRIKLQGRNSESTNAYKVGILGGADSVGQFYSLRAKWDRPF